MLPLARPEPGAYPKIVGDHLSGDRVAALVAKMREERDRALRESETRFHEAADSAPAPVWMTNAEGGMEFVNRALSDFAGMSAGALTGDVWLSLVHPDDRPEVVRRRALAWGAGHAPYTFEARFKRADGEWRMLEVSSRPRLDADGVFHGYVGLAVDRTDSRRADAALREREERYRDIFENVGVSVWEEDFSEVFDALDRLREQGVKDIRAHLERNADVLESLIRKVTILDVNASTLKVFGAARKEQVLGSLADIFTDEARGIFIDEMAAIWDGRTHLEAETRVRNMAGEVLDVLFTIVFGGERGARTLVSISDISERKRGEERQRLLLHELNHRVKNTLAAVQSIAMQSLTGEETAEGREAFIGRLVALAKGHDLLTRQNWEGAPLADVVGRAVEPFAGAGRSRFFVDGPFVWTPPRYALSLSMALHELCTNASKYGALSNERGGVAIAWRVDDSPQGPVLHFDWTERGGPEVKPPARRGFGSRMIERGLKQDLRGEVTFEFRRTGVVCSIKAPLNPLKFDDGDREAARGDCARA